MRWLGCLLIAANCVSVSAQVVPSAMGPGAFVAAGAGPSYFEAIYGQRHLAGFYAYAEVQPQWRWGFEGEARYLRWHTSEGVNESDHLGGVRYTAAAAWNACHRPDRTRRQRDVRSQARRS